MRLYQDGDEKDAECDDQKGILKNKPIRKEPENVIPGL